MVLRAPRAERMLVERSQPRKTGGNRMTSGTDIDIPAALAQARATDALVQSIQTSMTTLKNDADDTSNIWQGQKAREFVGTYQQFTGDYTKMQASLTDLSSTLTKSINALAALQSG
jgi:uncharacterized protein YukE